MSHELELSPYSGRIKVRGIVDITNGDYHQRARNHFQKTTLNALINAFAIAGTTTAATICSAWTSLTTYMVLGTDTTSPTASAMGGLVAPIGSAPGTKPNSQSGVTSTVSGGAEVVLTSVWNASTVTGTVGEIGLFLNLDPSLNAFSTAYTGTVNFGSRLSNADRDFVSFAINPSNPLSVNWTIAFTFA